MKTCSCGGMWYAHGKAVSKRGVVTERYMCKLCKKSISVRDGKIVDSRLGVRKKDWRSMDNADVTGLAPEGDKS